MATVHGVAGLGVGCVYGSKTVERQVRSERVAVHVGTGKPLHVRTKSFPLHSRNHMPGGVTTHTYVSAEK